MADRAHTPFPWVLNRGKYGHITNPLYKGVIAHLGEVDGVPLMLVNPNDHAVTAEESIGNAEILAGCVADRDAVETDAQTGPCGTPLTPDGIARYAFAAGPWTDAEHDWRFGHTRNLIASAISSAVEEEREAIAMHVDTLGSESGYTNVDALLTWILRRGSVTENKG